MERKFKPIEDIDTIRTIMERSTRFLSLSGLSGVTAGLIAVAGGIAAIFFILKGNTDGNFPALYESDSVKTAQLLFIDALLILIPAVLSSLLLSYRKAVRKGIKIWSPVSKRLVLNLGIPLITGGIFILILYNSALFGLIIPSMLIFYGLALVSAGKFTFDEILYLGILEIITGLAAAFFPAFGIFLWIFGFGLLHIIYGLVMYRKYDR
ncbi:MAG TPA: hypothetical protein VHO46_02975 [Bacteroidales bacterium]|nr:hypothetical protein [Bacteroidales bacterium]